MKYLILLPAFAFISCKDEAPATDDALEPKTSQALKLGDPVIGLKSESPIKETTPDHLIPPPTPPVGGKPVPLPSSGTATQPTPTPISKFQTAVAIPGRAGWVFNPWTNKAVDVRGIPPGSVVRDPNDSDPEHKFRIP